MKLSAILISVSVFSRAGVMLAENDAGTETDIGEYSTIVDRQMFGPLPPTFDSTKPPGQGIMDSRGAKANEPQLTKEQAQIRKSVHFSVINLTPSGKTAVGFTDNSNPKEPKHHYLKVGETSSDGWTVKDADAATSTMTIVKDGIEVALVLGQNSGGGASAPAGASPAALQQTARRSGGGQLPSASFKSRRAWRERKKNEEVNLMREQLAAQKRENEQKEALRKQEREEQRQQLNAIRDALAKMRDEKEKKDASEDGTSGNENNDAQ